MTQTLNLIAPKGEFSFSRLVADSFTRAGVEVRQWDYRREPNASLILDRDAPTLVLRGENIESVSRALLWLNGPRFLWFTEDAFLNGGHELITLAAYYDDIWLHWANKPAMDWFAENAPRKRVSVVPILYCDQNIWTPAPDGTEPETGCDVLHYGAMTPRREAILSELRRRLSPKGISIWQVDDPDHRRLAALCRKAKVVLNLHAHSPMNSEIRIAEALSTGTTVLSEQLPSGMGWIKQKASLHENEKSEDIQILSDMCAYLVASSKKDAEVVWNSIGYAETRFNHVCLAYDIAPRLGITNA